jgi:ketosteroid isomerase-like protein
MTLIAAVVGLLIVAGQPSPEPSPPSLPGSLARILSDYESAWQQKDAHALAGLFTEGGFVLPNGGVPVRGRAEIEKFYTGQGGPLLLRALAYSTDGNTGFIIGTFSRRKNEPDRGKFTLTLLKGAHGRWFILSDMDNANPKP